MIKVESQNQTDKSEKPHCSYCHSENIKGITRVVGYFSIIENWSKANKSKLKARQKGNYWVDVK